MTRQNQGQPPALHIDEVGAPPTTASLAAVYDKLASAGRTDDEIIQALRELGLGSIGDADEPANVTAARLLCEAAAERHADEERQTRRTNRVEWAKAVSPALSIILTFLLITWVGGRFEEARFERKVAYEGQLKRVETAVSEITQIALDLVDLQSRAETDLAEWRRQGADRASDNQAIREAYEDWAGALKERLVSIEAPLMILPESHQERIGAAYDATLTDIEAFIQHGDPLNDEHINQLRAQVGDAYIDFFER
jgi:hypothetical protein